jgi:hypothetical protein
LTAIGPTEPDDQGIAVGRRAHHEFGAEVAAGAGLVVDHELLLEALGELLRHGARQDVGGAAGGEGHHHLDRPGRIGRRLRPGEGGQQRTERHGAEQGSALHVVSLSSW